MEVEKKSPVAELDAMKDIAALLDPFTREERARILTWCEDMLVKSETRSILNEDVERMSAYFEELTSRAKELGVPARSLVHAYSALRERKVAPLVVREEIVEAEAQAAAT
ncbi:MAG: hypothetical protein J0H98_10670 [Solirubrobacterales bacterium]|nr:hypothetical protein [Solirubrobacterales bacterium]